MLINVLLYEWQALGRSYFSDGGLEELLTGDTQRSLQEEMAALHTTTQLVKLDNSTLENTVSSSVFLVLCVVGGFLY